MSSDLVGAGAGGDSGAPETEPSPPERPPVAGERLGFRPGRRVSWRIGPAAARRTCSSLSSRPSALAARHRDQDLGRDPPRQLPGHGRDLAAPRHADAGAATAAARGGSCRSTSENVRRPFFLLVSVAAIAFIMTLYRRLQPRQRALKWGLPLVLGGALGNVFDRIRYGHVIDFIDCPHDRARAIDTTGPRSTSPTSPSASASA